VRTTLFVYCSLAWLLFAQSASAQKYRIFSIDGLSASPPNASPGFGEGLITFDPDLMTLRVEASFGSLIGTTTASHIHCCIVDPQPTAGVATVTPSFTGFPLGVTSGTYDHTYDMTMASSYNASFITGNGGTVGGALNALLTGFDAGKAYLNIHTNVFPGGEIRGFLERVPEPSALMLALLGAVGLFVRRRRAWPTQTSVRSREPARNRIPLGLAC